MTKTTKKAKTSTDTKFACRVDSNLVVKAIDQILAIVPVSPLSVYRIEITDKLIISAIKDDTYCRVVIDAEVDNKCVMHLVDDGLPQLKTLIKGRGMLVLNRTPQEITFKSGRYSGTLKLADTISSNAELSFEKFATIKLSKKQMVSMEDGFFSTVNSAVAATRIVNSFFDGYISTALIEYKKSILTVLTFDDWHIHHFEAKVKSDTPDLRITIPTAIFGTLEKVIKGSNTFMFVDSEMFALKSDNMFIILPPMQEIEADAYLEFMHNLPKPICKAVCDATLGAALDNIAGLIKQEGSKRLDFSMQEKGGILSYSNSNGSVTDKFKISKFKGKAIKIGLDYPIFIDTFKAIKHASTFNLAIHGNSEGTPSIYSMKGSMLGGELSIMGHVSE